MSNYDVRGLLERRANLTDQYRAILDRATREGRDLTGEERATTARLDAEIDDLRTQADLTVEARQRAAEAAEARSAYLSVLGDPALDRRESRQNDDLAAFLRGETRTLDIDLRGVAREKALIRAGASGADLRREIRDLGEDTSSAGGYAVPVSFHRSLYDWLEVYTGVRRLNVTVLTTASGESLQVPVVASHGTASIRGEGTALGENDPTFTQVTLNAWKYGTLLQVSNELLQDAGIDMAGFVSRDVARAIARATDTHYVSGTGTGQPKGIISTQPVGATIQAGSTGVPSYGNLIDLVYSVNDEYRAGGAYWIMKDSMAAAIRKITDGNGRPIWEPNVQVGQPDMLLGYPVVQDPNCIAAGTAGGTPIAFGNFSGYYLRDVGTLRFEASPDFAFSSDQMTYRAIHRTDGKVVDTTGGWKFLKAPTT